METIYLAGGCFWGVEKFFKQFRGVLFTEVGYANGDGEEANSEDLWKSGHTETVKIEYDPSIIDLEKLLEYYFMIIDPLSVNKQGPDAGRQYRTGIYYTSNDQVKSIDKVVKKVEDELASKLAVEVEPIRNYKRAEEYHQKYLDKHPTGYCHIRNNMFHLEDQKKYWLKALTFEDRLYTICYNQLGTI